MRPNVTTEAGFGTYINQWWSSIPFITATVLAACISVYILGLFSGFDSFVQICTMPISITQWQVYRPWTSLFFHMGILHITFNMMAFVPIASSLERQLASLRFFYLILLFGLTNAVFHYSAAFVAAFNPVMPFKKLLFECGIGLSGVIFALIVIENTMDGPQNRSVFGLFTIPSKWYPWVLLALFQFMMPSVSFLGHLSGILSGLAYCHGFLNFAIPSPHFFSWLSSLSFMSYVTKRPSFIVGGGDLNSASLPSFVRPAVLSRSSNPLSPIARGWETIQTYLAERMSRYQQVPVTDPAEQGFSRSGRAVNQQQHHSGPAPGRPERPPSVVVGRTLGGQMPSHQLKPSEVAAKAAASRLSKQGIPPPNVTNPPMNALPLSTLDYQVDDGSLHALVSMGFESELARNTLEATNGNLESAIDLLSG